ncbi:MAG: hypothetical protein Q8O41_01575, partial [Candidatus Methanoperedens sp.]|nr:hypothetical protein [Candidatus Methanoperedens sp.]
MSNVNVDYSRNNGTDWINLKSGIINTNSTTWNIPTIIDLRTPNQAKIRVINSSYGTVYALSSSFKMKGLINVTSPTAVDTLHIGVPHNITWTTTGFFSRGITNEDDVVLSYSTNAGTTFTPITTLDYNYGAPAGTYAWTLPLDSITLDNQKKAVIEVKDLNDGTKVRGVSAGFDIEGQVTINEPNTSGLIWTVGSSHNIKWTPTGTYGTVEFHYSIDNFTSSNILIGQATNSASGVQGTYSWSIPTNLLSDSVRVRVRDAADADVKSISGYDVKLVGSLIVTAPNTETPKIVWYKGEAQNINWTANGAVTTVDIDYSTNGGTGWTNIITGEAGHTAGSNTKAITIPDENSENCLVKVTDSAHASVFNASVYPFAMRPVISVSQPVLDQRLAVGSKGNTITWSLNGS